MKTVKYANIAKNLLGDELYCKFLKEISKENNGGNLVDYGNEVIEKCCFLIIMIGMSKKIKLDKIKICLGKEIIEISSKEFASKYEKYTREIERNMLETVKEITK